MGLTGKVNALWNIYSEGGLRQVVTKVCDQFYEVVKFDVFQQDLKIPRPQVSCKVDFQIKRVIEADLIKFKDMPYPYSRHYEYWAHHGLRQCYAAVVGKDVGALMWPVFQLDNERLVNKWRYLLADEARISNIWADPKYRGTGLIDCCLEAFSAYLGKHGFRYMYAFPWYKNEGSKKLHLRRGFRCVGHVWRFNLRWQNEGHGIYIRQRISRDVMAQDHPAGDIALPDSIPLPVGYITSSQAEP